jgi:hypothetical protein
MYAQPIGPDARTYVFRQEGEYWTITRPGAVIRLRDTVGLHLLARLLGHPDQEFAAVDLAGGCGPTSAAWSDAGQMLDRRAIAGYRTRLESLRAELEDAVERNDEGRAEHARAEIEFLAAELSRAVGRGGRARGAGSFAVRARVNVTRTFRAAMRRMAAGDAALGRHFVVSVRTGSYCIYSPDPQASVRWQL